MNAPSHSPTRLLFLLILLNFTFQGSVNAQNSLLGGMDSGTSKNSRIDLGGGDSLAVVLIKGGQKGPVFTIVAGIHGYEYPPIIAVQKFLTSIRAEDLRGDLLIIPIANKDAFFGRSVFTNPTDGKNLNRVFPGSDTGTVTEKIAAFISKEVIPISDVFLDIHGGDASEDLLPFVCYYDRKDAPDQVELARKLTVAAGFKYNVVYPYTLNADEPSEYAFKEAVQQGKTALSIEAGKLGTVQPDNVAHIEQGIWNMLKEMKMVEGTLVPFPDQKWLTTQVYVKTPVQGIFYSEVKSGDKIAVGQSLGYITTIFGEKIEEIIAPEAGIVLYKIGTPPVNTGETLFCIGRCL